MIDLRQRLAIKSDFSGKFEMEDIYNEDETERVEKTLGGKNENLEIARYLLEEGIAVDFIAKATGLTEEEIQKLQT